MPAQPGRCRDECFCPFLAQNEDWVALGVWTVILLINLLTGAKNTRTSAHRVLPGRKQAIRLSKAVEMKIECLMLAHATNPLAGEVLTCFVQQSAITNASLFIYNPDPIEVRVDHPKVRVVNEFQPSRSLRCILKRMLDLSDDSADLIQWWNETSLYLPWHLEHCLSNIGSSVAWKPESSWLQADDCFTLLRHLFEGSWTFRAAYLRAAPLDTHCRYSGHPVFLQTVDAGLLTTTEFGGRTSYISRCARSLDARHDQTVSADNLEFANEVFSGVYLVPIDLNFRWRQYLDGILGQVTPQDWQANQKGVALGSAHQWRNRLSEMQGAESFSESEDVRQDVIAAERLSARKQLRKNHVGRERARWASPPGRAGHVVEIGGFAIFVDGEKYDQTIAFFLDLGWYEKRENDLARQLVQPTDRIIEAGTGLGLVSMTAASIAGAENVLTFEAHPGILKDARENFARNGLAFIKSCWGVLKPRRNVKQPNEESDFYIDKAFWTSRLGTASLAPGIIQKIRVPVFCLEDEVKAHKANVLICDIEGGEAELLTLADLSGIRMIILETHYHFAGEAATDAMVRKLVFDNFRINFALSGNHLIVLHR
jgi:FkbM family methyltransferase